MATIDRVMAAYTKTRPNLSDAQAELVRRELAKFIEELMSDRLSKELKS